jgi:hypothetical protein
VTTREQALIDKFLALSQEDQVGVFGFIIGAITALDQGDKSFTDIETIWTILELSIEDTTHDTTANWFATS